MRGTESILGLAAGAVVGVAAGACTCGGVVRPAGQERPAPGERAPGPPDRGASVDRAWATPPVVLVPEMEPLAPDVSESPVAVAPAVRSGFDAAWGRVRASVEAGVTGEALAGISQWARDQTRSARLAPGWIAAMPMEPIGRTADGKAVFGQSAERSPAVLPSHVPIVFRRVVVAAVYDARAGGVERVFVSIRGWVEE